MKDTATLQTNERIIEFINEANVFIATNKDETKFKYALEKTVKHCNKLLTPYNEEIELVNEKLQDARALNCATDEKGVQIKDGDKHQFTPEGEKKCLDAVRVINKAWRKKKETLDALEIEVTPFFVSQEHLPADLTMLQTEIFTGFVIEEVPAQKTNGKEKPQPSES